MHSQLHFASRVERAVSLDAHLRVHVRLEHPEEAAEQERPERHAQQRARVQSETPSLRCRGRLIRDDKTSPDQGPGATTSLQNCSQAQTYQPRLRLRIPDVTSGKTPDVVLHDHWHLPKPDRNGRTIRVCLSVHSHPEVEPAAVARDAPDALDAAGSQRPLDDDGELPGEHDPALQRVGPQHRLHPALQRRAPRLARKRAPDTHTYIQTQIRTHTNTHIHTWSIS